MSLRACKECGKEVSSQAKACPHCGAPPRRSFGCGTLLLVLIALLVGYSVIVNLLENPSSSDSAEMPPETLERTEHETILEIRISKDLVNIRTGPGTNYAKDKSGTLTLGEKLYILERQGEWLRFRVTPMNVDWSGWVRRDLTLTEGEYTRRKDELWKQFYRSPDRTIKEKLEAARAGTAE